MSKRFARLRKIPSQPAARLMAATGVKIGTKLDAPASASVEAVLAELEEKKAWVDIVRIFSMALPAREVIWWGCVAARDIVGEKATPCLLAAESWVFEPNDAKREKLQSMLEAADPDDDTALIATAALYAQGTLGVGDMAEIEAPPGAVSACTFGMNIKTMEHAEDPLGQLQWIIDRAVDIAKGGNGKLKQVTPAPEPMPVED